MTCSTFACLIDKLIDWLVFDGTSTQDRSICAMLLTWEYRFWRLRVANEEQYLQKVTMKIKMQRKTTGMLYLLDNLNCIQQTIRHRLGEKRKMLLNSSNLNTRDTLFKKHYLMNRAKWLHSSPVLNTNILGK